MPCHSQKAVSRGGTKNGKKMNTKESSLINVIATILECGYDDVKFLINELEDFGVDFSDIWEEANEIYDKPTLNDVLYRLYKTVVDRYDISKDRYSIFTNCLDSHLHIDGEECYDEGDVKAKSTAEETEDN